MAGDNQKTSCPYTYRQLTDDHRGWCGRVKGTHCKQHQCPWRDEPGVVEAKEKPAVVQKTLW